MEISINLYHTNLGRNSFGKNKNRSGIRIPKYIIANVKPIIGSIALNALGVDILPI